MKLTKRKGFNFFRSYYDVYNELSDKDKVAFMDALLDRQFLGKKPTELKGMAKFAYISQTNSIDSQVKGYEDKTGTTLGEESTPRQGGVSTPTGQVEEKEEEQVEEKEVDSVGSSNEQPADPNDKFLTWFNSLKGKHTGKVGKFKVLSTTDERNFKKLKDKYSPKDFNIAFSGMVKNKWVQETKNLTPSHFLAVSNFNRYLEQAVEETPLSKLEQIKKERGWI
jgi:hypothetical protein